MILQDNTVICIKTNEETWDLFNSNYYVKEIPKRKQLLLLKEGIMGHIFDINVVPQFRKPEYYKSISFWASHIMALTSFVKEETSEWLLVIESDVDLGYIHEPEKGFTLLSSDARSYIVDRDTANIIINNSLVYYDSFLQTVKDMGALHLIEYREATILFPLHKKNLIFNIDA